MKPREREREGNPSDCDQTGRTRVTVCLKQTASNCLSGFEFDVIFWLIPVGFISSPRASVFNSFGPKLWACFAV